MNCPECGEEMEGESFPVVTEVRQDSANSPIRTKKVPTGHYYCPGCDSEWVWYKRKSSLRKIDGGVAEINPTTEML